MSSGRRPVPDNGSRTIEVDGHEIKLSNLDKLFFPQAGLTKGDLVHYYDRIAAVALRHWKNRPLTMRRFPDGLKGDSFFQKQIGGYFPDWVERVELSKEDGAVTHVLVNDRGTMVYLADQAVIEPHVGLSRIDRINKPDRLIFDLDPSGDDFGDVQWAAGILRDALDDLDLVAAVMTTGSRGLHVVVPLDRSESFDPVRDFAGDLADYLAGQYPKRLTVEQRKKKRGNRVYLDVLRNAYGQTGIAPYGVRARPYAPVATPLDWDEALASGLGPQDYTITNLFARLGQKEDPWANLGRQGRSLGSAKEKLARKRA